MPCSDPMLCRASARLTRASAPLSGDEGRTLDDLVSSRVAHQLASHERGGVGLVTAVGFDTQAVADDQRVERESSRLGSEDVQGANPVAEADART